MSRKKVGHALRRSIIIAIFLLSIIFLINIAPNYVVETKIDDTKLIINNNNVTMSLKNKIRIVNNIAYLSTDDIKNFFDEYLIQDDNEIITTSNTKTVNISKSSNILLINGSKVRPENNLLIEDNKTYLPIDTISDIYNLDAYYSIGNNCLVIDSLSKRYVQGICNKDVSIKFKETALSKTIEKIDKGEEISIVQNSNNEDSEENGWVKVRTKNGNIGYLQRKNIISEKVVRDNLEEKRIEGKVGLVWDYYSQYTVAPTRTESIKGVNVVAPSFYEVKSDGTIMVNFGETGKKYVEWAHSNNYEVWPVLSNSMLNNLDLTSNLLKTFSSRANLIENIINVLIENNVDGINVDFENMYKEDKDNYSRFLIELAPRLQDIGMMLSVWLTAPDGSDTWSLCYDRNTIGSVADYVIFMGWDQRTGSSTTAGTIAGYDWDELNITKFLGQEEIPSQKVILGIPFYTRIWMEQNNRLTNRVLNMNSIRYTIPNYVEKTWNNETKQNYCEYTSNSVTYKVWLEDVDSVSAKLDLVNEYNLAGAGFWEKDRETEDIWNVAKEKLNIGN